MAAKEALLKHGKVWLGDRTGILKVMSLRALSVQYQFRVHFLCDDFDCYGTIKPLMVYKLGTDERGFFFQNYWLAYGYHIREKNSK